jgi:uncharacterized protein with HEPN domain
MSREIKKLLTDIDKSINMISAYLQYVPTLEVFENDIMIMDAIYRRLSIIGEALWKADKMDKNLQISDKPEIISLRHIIIQDDTVDNPAIWVICHKHLPVLKQEVQALLSINYRTLA